MLDSDLDDSAFLDILELQDFIRPYETAKKDLAKTIDTKYKTERTSLEEKKNLGIKQDKEHRMILNACIFPFAQQDSLKKFGYYFLRASPLSELHIHNLDFLLFRPDPKIRIIMGEVKGSVTDPSSIVLQMKDRITKVEANKEYIKTNYLKNSDAEHEYVIGVDWSDGNNTMKAVLRKGGNIKVWNAGITITDSKHTLKLETPASADGPVGKTMLHADQQFSRILGNGIETSRDYKIIFPESHTFAKLSLLTLIREREDEDDTFTYTDFYDLVKEELNYLENDEIVKITDRILKIAQDIKFIEELNRELETDIRRFKIVAKGKKADTREDELRRKWLDFAILKDKEQEFMAQIQLLQDEYREKKSNRKTLFDYK